MNTKLVAKNPTTGLYFDGASFAAKTVADAKELRPGTTAADFSLMWTAPVVVENAILGEKSYALRIYEKEITRYDAAREYVTKAIRDNNQKTFTVRTPDGRYISRAVKVEQTGVGRCAWVNFQRSRTALVWSGGELAVDY
jgi:hypothetical protein